MTERQLKPLFEAAVEAAPAAAPVLRGYFGNGWLGLELKLDRSPLTRADREAETVIRAQLAAAPGGPLDVLGEEEGFSGAGTRWRWPWLRSTERAPSRATSRALRVDDRT
jgi:fructose-1,6-bisphosphatase/inositol monophosphatase family enzyme